MRPPVRMPGITKKHWNPNSDHGLASPPYLRRMSALTGSGFCLRDHAIVSDACFSLHTSQFVNIILRRLPYQRLLLLSSHAGLGQLAMHSPLKYSKTDREVESSRRADRANWKTLTEHGQICNCVVFTLLCTPPS
eukprot:6245487-Amphidinium_carterae.1